MDRHGLKRFMGGHGLTVKDLSLLVGVSQSSVYAWLAGAKGAPRYMCSWVKLFRTNKILRARLKESEIFIDQWGPLQ